MASLHQIYTKVGGVLTPLAVLRERVLVFYDGLFFDTEPTVDIDALTYDDTIADTVGTGVGYEDAFSDNTPTVTIV